MTDHYYMQQALLLAQRAYDEGEIPVGALVVCNARIIGKGYNQTEKLQDVTAHAEMLAITAATQYIGAKYLKDCTLYVTLEPCVMCAGALSWSQIGKIVIGASDEKRGFSTYSNKLLHPKTILTKGVLGDICEDLIKSFFREMRRQ
jgi:tRNA(adenine34) deaminase